MCRMTKKSKKSFIWAFFWNLLSEPFFKIPIFRWHKPYCPPPSIWALTTILCEVNWSSAALYGARWNSAELGRVQLNSAELTGIQWSLNTFKKLNAFKHGITMIAIDDWSRWSVLSSFALIRKNRSHKVQWNSPSPLLSSVLLQMHNWVWSATFPYEKLFHKRHTFLIH